MQVRRIDVHVGQDDLFFDDLLLNDLFLNDLHDPRKAKGRVVDDAVQGNVVDVPDGLHGTVQRRGIS